MPNEFSPIRHLRIITPESGYPVSTESDDVQRLKFKLLMDGASVRRSISQVPTLQQSLPLHEHKDGANAEIIRTAPPLQSMTSCPLPQSDNGSLTRLENRTKDDNSRLILPSEPTRTPDFVKSRVASSSRVEAHRVSDEEHIRSARRIAQRKAVHASPATDQQRPADSSPNKACEPTSSQILSRVVSLVRSSPPSIEDQTITVKLDPALIDETTLHVSISRAGLSVRFESPILASRTLLYAHVNTLATQLESRIKRPTQISISG
jgi:hypothetical protein